jgi:hypothetical protein
MSVAFRRESDEEHLEPKFELPIPLGRNLVTPRGLQLIRERVDALEAAAAGEPTPKRASRSNATCATGAPASPPPRSPASCRGHCRYRYEGDLPLRRSRAHLAIVGHDEADPDAGLIAFSAPLAAALVGLEAGEFADFNGKEDAIELLAVTPPPEPMPRIMVDADACPSRTRSTRSLTAARCRSRSSATSASASPNTR